MREWQRAFGRKITRWVAANELTDAEAAEVIGVNRVNLRNWIHGKSGPDAESVRKVAMATGIGADYWLGIEV